MSEDWKGAGPAGKKLDPRRDTSEEGKTRAENSAEGKGQKITHAPRRRIAAMSMKRTEQDGVGNGDTVKGL